MLSASRPSSRPIIAGSIPLPVREFKQALGRTGFTVWAQLCALRDPRGVCTATVAEIAGEKLCHRYVRKGLEILRRMHLVVRVKGVHATAYRRARVVVGVVGRDVRGDVVLVHGDAWRALRMAYQWGGTRDGAGRKKVAADQLDLGEPLHPTDCAISSEPAALEVTDCAISSEPAAGAGEKIQKSEIAKEIFQEGPFVNQEGPFVSEGFSRGAVCNSASSTCNSENDPLRSRGLESAPPYGGCTRARALSRSDPILTIPVVASLQQESCAPPSGAVISTDVVGCGRKSPGRWDYPGVPPVPDEIKPVCTPPPPPIDPTRPVGEQVELLARTWENAVSHHYLDGRDCWTFKRYGGALNSPHYRLLRKAIEQFDEHQIAPAAWLAFAFDTWDSLGDDTPEEKPKRRKRKKAKRKPPPLKWAFGPDFITKWRGWFRRENAETVLGGRLLFTDKHRELIHRHTVMRYRLLALNGPTPTQIRREVHKVFPDGLYERLVEAVKIEVKREQDAINHRARFGGWIW